MLTIITPVLNGRKFIQTNIESIEKLKIPFEHIVVDGGSTDGTVELVKKFSHIKILDQTEKSGMYGAIHQGIMASTGPYVTWVNADDMIISEGYDLLYKKAIANEADLIYSHGIHHYIENFYYERIFAKHFCRYLLREGIFPFVQPSVIFSRRAYDLVGGFKYENFKLIGDRDLFQRMAYNETIKFLFVPVFSSVFLRHQESLLYQNLEERKLEYPFCIKSKYNYKNRLIFHSSQFLRSVIWPFNCFIKKLNEQISHVNNFWKSNCS